MSRAFVKESDVEGASGMPDLPQSPHTNYITPAGFARLRQREQWLSEEKARLETRGDLDAQQALAAVERDLRFVQQRVECAVVVDPATQPDDRVHFGATVEASAAGGERYRFAIVGVDEADPEAGRISWVSPLAKALMDHAVGEEVVWQRPAGNLRLEILAIRKGGS